MESGDMSTQQAPAQGRLLVVSPALLPLPRRGGPRLGAGRSESLAPQCAVPKWGGRAKLLCHRGLGEPLTDSLAEAQAKMLMREGACWGDASACSHPDHHPEALLSHASIPILTGSPGGPMAPG